MKGVVLIASGNPQYGNMAHQLCLSIKFSSPEIPVALFYTESAVTHLEDKRRMNFDVMTLLEPKHLRTGKRPDDDGLRAKTYLYELSPFSETIAIDVDTLWLPQKPVTALLEELKDLDFTMSCRSVCEVKDATETFIHWADSTKIVKEYGLTEGKLYNVSSEFIYFRKCDKVKALFNTIRDVYDNLKVPHVYFGGGIPDEVAFTIALAIHSFNLHQDIFIPCYWEPYHKQSLLATEMYKKFWALSVGGAHQDSNIMELYNNLAQYYCNQFGARYHFPLKNKRDYLPERTKI